MALLLASATRRASIAFHFACSAGGTRERLAVALGSFSRRVIGGFRDSKDTLVVSLIRHIVNCVSAKEPGRDYIYMYMIEDMLGRDGWYGVLKRKWRKIGLGLKLYPMR